LSYLPVHSLDSFPSLNAQSAPEQAGVRVDTLTFRYGEQTPILQEISFTLKVGERIALLGRTGTGKSTLMENLVGLKQPNSGEIRILGTPLVADTLDQIRRQVGFLFSRSKRSIIHAHNFRRCEFWPP
jgi:cobalt/nickel transport system ATP-binding protein